jgi:hypothetical protein
MKIKIWKCEVCKNGTVALACIGHRSRYGCLNCLSVYFSNKKRDKRYKPLKKESWLPKDKLPTEKEILQLISNRISLTLPTE